MSGNYPAGVTDNDPHFDMPSVGDDEFGNPQEDVPDEDTCYVCAKKAWADGWAGVAFQVNPCDVCELPTCATCAEPDFDLQGDPPQYRCTGWKCPKCRKGRDG